MDRIHLYTIHSKTNHYIHTIKLFLNTLNTQNTVQKWNGVQEIVV